METVTEHPAAEQSNKIERYELSTDESNHPFGEKSTGGEWVKYEDHVAAMLNPMGHQLTGDDKVTTKLVQHIIDNICNEEQSPEFAGFRFQRACNDEGELLFIALIPCDKLAGVTAPRFSFEETKAPAIKAATAAQVKLVTP